MYTTINDVNWNYACNGIFDGKPCRVSSCDDIYFEMPRKEAHKYIESKEYQSLILAGFEIHIHYKR